MRRGACGVGRAGTVVAVGGVVLLFFVFLLWYGGWVPVFWYFCFYPFSESSCLGAPGLAFLSGWGLAFVSVVGRAGVYRRARVVCIDWCLVGVFWFPFLGVCVAINGGVCFLGIGISDGLCLLPCQCVMHLGVFSCWRVLKINL